MFLIECPELHSLLKFDRIMRSFAIKARTHGSQVFQVLISDGHIVVSDMLISK